jgi:uncharacterized protein YjbI with pentapeptide repeats
MDNKRPVEGKKRGFKQRTSSKEHPWWKRLWGWTKFGEKSGWEYLELLSALAIPVVLAAAGFWFTAQQDQRQQQIEDQRAQAAQKIESQRAQEAQKIESQRAEAERELAEQRAQDEALQAYLDQMSGLLLEKDLRTSEEDSEVRTLARARTLTVLERLDPSRKTAVIQFLVEAQLIQRVEGRGPIISLGGANLREADLSLLSDTNLRGANLRGADLREAALIYADLRGADLREADLRGTNLSSADLREANLGEADLTGAGLWGADLREAELVSAYLGEVLPGEGARINPAPLPGLREADLSGANLTYADLSGADLGFADLSKAALYDADLSGADLSGADLSEAKGISNEELEQVTSSLKGATMPDGKSVTTEFEPAALLSYNISDGWQLYTETPDELILIGPEGGELSFFASPSRVFDPSNPGEATKVSAPENADEWVSWFQEHPNLDTSDPVSATLGSAAGVRIDVTLPATPDKYPRAYCGEKPCVPLFPSGGGIVSYADWKDRFFIVDVEGETVVIDVAAPEDKFGEFLPNAQKVLDTIEWAESE